MCFGKIANHKTHNCEVKKRIRKKEHALTNHKLVEQRAPVSATSTQPGFRPADEGPEAACGVPNLSAFAIDAGVEGAQALLRVQVFQPYSHYFHNFRLSLLRVY